MQEKRNNLFVFTIRKKRLVALFLLVFIVSVGVGAYFLFFRADLETARPLSRPVVVLDAGHGGVDAGVTAKGGLKESDFNLAMVYLLQDLFSQGGFSVVLTRRDEKGLYGATDGDFKRADMKARKEIIQSTDPDLVISVHANKYPSASRRGAQAFFDGFNPAGKALAFAIQDAFNVLNEKTVGRTFSALSGDYYILKCTHAPSVIVECGFLSNPEDEKLLSDAAYREELARSIYAGTVVFLADRTD